MFSGERRRIVFGGIMLQRSVGIVSKSGSNSSLTRVCSRRKYAEAYSHNCRVLFTHQFIDLSVAMEDLWFIER